MAPILQAEIDRNYDAFQRQIGAHLASREGQYALMRGGEIVKFYPTAFAAEAAGSTGYEDGVFSIQEVSCTPADLGFFTHAFDNR